MKKHLSLLFCSLLVLITNILFSQTSIPAGNVFGIWTLSGSPYNIQGNILIPNDSTLTIEAGVVVDFQGTYKLNVQGRIIAIGSITDTIEFTASNISTGWKGIRFEQTAITNDTSKISYCKLKYGNATGISPNNRGGALFFDSFSKAIISNTYISNCSATNGGGIYCDVSAPLIENNVIAYNMATYGGGIFCSGNPPLQPIINKNIISNNSATVGGGLLISYLNPVVSNNIISNNTASSWAGGIYCNGTNASFDGNTIVNNLGHDAGGGIYCTYGATPIFENTILWGNTSDSGNQVFIDDDLSAPEFLYSNLEGDMVAIVLNGNPFIGVFQNNISIDPLFVFPSGASGMGFNGLLADWSLQNNSPCINTGNPVGVYTGTDNKGNARVTVCRIDMGAIEYQNGIPFSITINQTQSVLCFGDSAASVAVIATGGTRPYNYLWNTGETDSTRVGLSAGSYTVTVTEAGLGCASTKAININQPQAPLTVVVSSLINPVCVANNGSVEVVSSGGTQPYSYHWSTNSNDTTSTRKLCCKYFR